MTITILSLVILAQIALFQIISALANKAIMLQELQSVEGPAPERPANHLRRAPKVRLLLGVVLAGLVLLPLMGILRDPGLGKLLLVGVAVASAIAFARANARDRKMMRLLADHTPGGSVRRASLEPRSLRQWYHPALEAIPVLLFVATLVFLVTVPGFMVTEKAATGSALADERLHVLVLFGLQGLMVFGGFFYSLRKGVDVNSMASYIPSLNQRPEVALRLGEELAGTQLRFSMFAKIVIAALLGAAVVENVLEAIGKSGATLWDAVGWVLIAVIVIGFLFYLRKVGRISRQMQQETELANHNAQSAG